MRRKALLRRKDKRKTLKKITKEILKEAIRTAVSERGYAAKTPDALWAVQFPDVEAEDFAEALDALAENGEIAFSKRGKVMPLSESGLVRGVLRGTSRAFAFVSPDGGGEDLFIPPSRLGGAIDGDTVLVRTREEKPCRRAHRRPAPKSSGKSGEAEVVRVVSRGIREVTGTFYETGFGTGGYVSPDNRKLNFAIRVSARGAKRAASGDKVLVSIETYPDDRTDASGKIKEVYGRADSREANYMAILHEHSIPTSFSAAVLRDADESAARELSPRGRRDLRDRILFTIDGADAKDLDDAISLERTGDGGWLLGVHIADVSEYVREGSPTDAEAFRRSTSIYFTDQVVPMLPRSLSNGACSLNAGEDRYAMSAFLTLAPDGALRAVEVAETLIRSSVRGVYSEVNDLFEYGERSPFYEKYRAVYPMLCEMHALYRVLAQRALSRGALELETREAKIVLDETGTPVDVIARERGDAERLIEQFMLCANEGVATYLTERSMPCVYRVHEDPDPEKIRAFSVFAHNLGLDTSALRQKKLRPAHLASVMRAASEKGIGEIVSNVLLRSLMKAKYSQTAAPHFGLAIDLYCHFTSPIRRYPDLSVHRILKDVLHGRAAGKRLRALTAFATKSASQSSENEVRAISAEREIEDLYKAVYMSGHVGEEMDAIISSITSFGMFAQTDKLCEGLIPLETMRGRFTYDERTFTLSCGRTVYRLGDAVRVRIADVSIPERRVRMELV